MIRIICLFIILFSINILGQSKQKTIYIEINDSSKIFFLKSNDSITVIYDVFVKDDKYPIKLENNRREDDNLKVISNFEYQKLKKQILSFEVLKNLTSEEFYKLIEGNKIFVIDLSDRKTIKKVLVRNMAYFLPD